MIALLIPTGSDHDRSRVPAATFSIIAANVIIYIVSNCLNYRHVVETFGFVAGHPQPWQFLTHMFLHAGWPSETQAPWTDYLMSLLHIGGNMAYLWFAGSDLEDVLGPRKFLSLYFVSGLASVLLYWLTAVAGHFPNIDEPLIGASGAISGLLGYYLVRFPRFKIRMWFGAFIPVPFIMRHGITRISSLFFIGFWIGLQLIFGVYALRAGGAQVAYWGHIGGFAFGLALALATREWRQGEEEYLMKEADHLFYKQKWYPAMEVYQRLAGRYPRCADARAKWALCWECTGMVKRAHDVLLDALAFYRERNWPEQASIIEQELCSMTRKAIVAQSAPATPAKAAVTSPVYPNLMFRKEFKWKGKPHD
ncbi:MAG TPA: rhomboid family intramembrane serine protease [Verrucomicrobiae bacterium]|nr:rhomboid family intramembrane serine protease [Verrucomicrobiae bacterium]